MNRPIPTDTARFSGRGIASNIALDGNYAAFANVTEGMEVVDDFMKVDRDMNSIGEVATPKTPIVMERVEMLEPDQNGEPRVMITMNDFIGETK